MAFEYDMAARGASSRYEYLYRCLRTDIESGEVRPGERLPSKRVLAKRVGVSLVTVEKAYGQLEAEGYAVARERSGYFAAQALPASGADAVQGRTAKPVPEAASASASEPGVAATTAMGRAAMPAAMPAAMSAPATAQPGQLNPSASIAPSPAASPHGVQSGLIADFSWPASNPGVAATLWSKALRDTLAHESDRELYAPQPSRGSLRLRRAIAAHLASFRGMDVDPGRIVIGAGAQMLYGMVAQLVQPTEVERSAGGVGNASERPSRPIVAVENPGYPRLSGIYTAYGWGVCHVPVDAEGIDMDGLDESGATMVHIMPSHQFPTGRVTSVTRRYELLGWLAGGPERYLVEDDYDNEFRLAGRPVPSLASIDVLGRVIYIGTFSKSLGSALRLAYMVLPPVLSRRYDDVLGFSSSTVSVVDQICLSRLLESGDYERHVNRYRTQRKAVRDLFLDALRATPAGRMCQVEEADSGLHFVLAVMAGCTEAQVARQALRRGVRLAPMSQYAQMPRDGGMADRRMMRARTHAGTHGGAVESPLPGYQDAFPRFVMQYDGLTADAAPQAARALAAGILEAVAGE
ncbi:MAG: PLP-dependent aminotransferase family protein [Bifidobacteriaceae bacterium]|nr:PLP-dependent aminotransferase family protein [Bifidobacteriaceae bacterium]